MSRERGLTSIHLYISQIDYTKAHSRSVEHVVDGHGKATDIGKAGRVVKDI